MTRSGDSPAVTAVQRAEIASGISTASDDTTQPSQVVSRASESERILFLTGKLAEPALRRTVSELSGKVGFQYEIRVLPISVAALMHSDWIQRHLDEVKNFDRVIVPGWVQGGLTALEGRFSKPFVLGPKELFDLPEFFGNEARPPVCLDQYDIEILAEINHAPRMSDDEIMRMAGSFRQSGAEIIDLGCVPGESWNRVGDVIRLLRADGFRVSIDSFEQREVESAVAAGAELVLSCNSRNLDWASRLGVELVAIPDDPHDLDSLEVTMQTLKERGVPFRADPVLEPIGFGFAASLARYFEMRRRYPDVEMMMGIGNLTELTEVDSAGVNMLLAAICQELEVRSVLTTEVINWSRSAVREFDFARRLVYHSVRQQVLPKHVDSQLVMLRDPKVGELGDQELQSIAGKITDPNFRIFVERGEIHVMNRDGYWRGTDAFELFDRAIAGSPRVDPSHAFYLGYELSKAVTALTLGKQYRQDEALEWGMLTVPEQSAHERRKAERKVKDAGSS